MNANQIEQLRQSIIVLLYNWSHLTAGNLRNQIEATRGISVDLQTLEKELQTLSARGSVIRTTATLSLQKQYWQLTSDGECLAEKEGLTEL